jgi:hypothetical protein
MNQFFQFVLHSEGLHFAFYIAASVIIGGMPAPTAQSSIRYRWAFKSLNLFASNWMRVKSTSVESSPNFQAAVDIQTEQAGLPHIEVQKPPQP